MSDRPCRNDFEAMIQFELFGLDASTAANIMEWLAESGRAGRFVHFVTEGCSNYDQACALEDALIDTDQCKDWIFVVGAITGDPDTKAWLEYLDEIVVPYGPERKQTGSDIGVWSREAFDELEYSVIGIAPASPESGIVLNAQMRAQGLPILGEM